MRILMVSLYPPLRDGIASYAVQTVSRLRAEGHDVEVLSPGPSAAHHHLDLIGPRGALALARRVRKYDQVIVQFHPGVFYPNPSSWQQRAMEGLALAFAWRAARDLELRVHEVDYTWGQRHGLDAIATRMMFRAADRIVVHTDAEAQDFHDAFGVPRDRLVVTAHGTDFARRVEPDRNDARARLGIPHAPLMFLAIGFIQPHKGFDRAVRAFDGITGARLDVVGSVRVEEPEYVRHFEELKQLAAHTPGVELHDAYVTDDDFDRWLVAADVVVLPYRWIWSSGVLERAALYDRPVIATRVGGLDAQAAGRASVTIVEDDAGLAAAMRAAAGQSSEHREQSTWANAAPVSRDAVMDGIRARAAASRPHAARSSHGAPFTAATDASAPLRRTPPLSRPAPISGRLGAGIMKRVVRRLIDWEVEPIVRQVNHLRDAAIEAAEAQAIRPEQAPEGERDREPRPLG